MPHNERHKMRHLTISILNNNEIWLEEILTQVLKILKHVLAFTSFEILECVNNIYWRKYDETFYRHIKSNNMRIADENEYDFNSFCTCFKALFNMRQSIPFYLWKMYAILKTNSRDDLSIGQRRQFVWWEFISRSVFFKWIVY